MAELLYWTISDVLYWLDTINLSKYKPVFQELKIDGVLLSNLTKEDLLADFHIKDPFEVSKILSSISNLEKNPGFSDIFLMVRNEKNNTLKSFPFTAQSLSIGSDISHPVNLLSISKDHCEIRYEFTTNRFYIQDLHSKTGTFFQLQKLKKLFVGMEFFIGNNSFEVSDIFYKLGIPCFCRLKINNNCFIEFGKQGCSIGKNSRNSVVINGEGVSNVHAIINKDFCLECIRPCFLKLKPGLFYSFVVGQVIKIEDFYIFFDRL